MTMSDVSEKLIAINTEIAELKEQYANALIAR